MADRDLVVLRAVRDVGLPDRSLDGLRERVASTLEREIAAERRRSRRPRRPLPRLGGLLTAMGSLLAIAIVVGAVALLHRGPSQPARPASAQGLIAKLAVLRRPQTSADVLPAHLKFRFASRGAIIGSLTRLVAAPPGGRLYLVVTTPWRGPGAIWSPGLGDQVAIVYVVGSHASESIPVPAAGLDDSGEVGLVGGFANRSAVHSAVRAYEVAVIPDGVARVRWRFANSSGVPTRSVDPYLGSNVAYYPFARAALFLRGTWYASDGSVIPSSDKALRNAIAGRQNALRMQEIRRYARYHYRPPRALLAAFAVFSIMSRTGVHVSGGLTISWPSIESLPYPIVNMADPNQPAQLDPYDTRQVTSPSGLQLWVIPGAHGLCVAELDHARFPSPLGLETGAGEGCSPNVAAAESGGSGVSSGRPGGLTTTYLVRPNSNPTITIRTGRHGRRTIRLPYGVYMGTDSLAPG